MYNGTPKKHIFQAKSIALNVVNNWFGMESKIEQINEDIVKVTIKADDISFEYLGLRYTEHLFPSEQNAETPEELLCLEQ